MAVGARATTPAPGTYHKGTKGGETRMGTERRRENNQSKAGRGVGLAAPFWYG